MGITHLVLIAALAVATSQSISPKAETPRFQAPAAELAAPGKNADARIFPAPPPNAASRLRFVQLRENPTVNQQMQPRVVCGMMVFPVKPDADPRMIIRKNNDPQPEYKIGKIPPQMCNE